MPNILKTESTPRRGQEQPWSLKILQNLKLDQVFKWIKLLITATILNQNMQAKQQGGRVKDTVYKLLATVV